MIASLNQRPSSPWSTAMSKSGRTFIAGDSRIAAEHQNRFGGIDAQADAAPLEYVLFAGDEIFDHAHAATVVVRTDLFGAEVEPELLRPAGEGDRTSDGVILALGFF